MTNKDNGGPDSDRELLEMAANAAGFNGLGSWDEKLGYMWDGEGWSFDPMNDDGDALRLAVELRLEIINDNYMVIARQRNPHKHGAQESLSTDSYAATRRAIVRAAAAIGSAM